MSVAETPPCDTCIWQYGLPDLYQQNILDERGHQWYAGSFVKDDTTFFQSEETKDMPSLVKAASIFGYSYYLRYPIDDSVRTKPLTDEMWRRMETMHKRFLGRCSEECYKNKDCFYAFGVMKYLTKDDFSTDKKLDDDFYDSKYGYLVKSNKGVYFKCYSVPSGHKSKYSYAIDPSHIIEGTKQWHLKAAKKPDDHRMMFTHFMPRIPNEVYVEKGYCSDCTWSIGLPDATYTPYKNWEVGSVAKEKPIFMKQFPELKHFSGLKHIPGYDPTSTSTSSTTPPPPPPKSKTVRKLADDEICYQPSNSPMWDRVVKRYQELLDLCYSECNKDPDCYGVNAVASSVDPHVVNNKDWDSDIYSYFYNENNECIHKSGCRAKEVLMKCYFFPDYKQPEFEKNYADIDKDYKIQGTRQFKVLKAEYETKNPMALFSHYWTRKDYQCNTCTWKSGIPINFRTDVSDERGQTWSLGTFDKTNKLLFQSPSTNKFKSLIAPVSIFRYSTWLQNSLDMKVLTKSLDDVMWPRLEHMYQRFLGRCSQRCHDIGTTNCEYSFAVLKYITDEQINDPNVKLDEDIASIKGGAAVYFKCYSVPKLNKLTGDSPPYQVEFEQVGESSFWQAKGGMADTEMLSTHYWKNDGSYTPEGYCDHCDFPYGLPTIASTTYDEMNMRDSLYHPEWKVGTLAKNQPAFVKQEATKTAIVLDGPLTIGDDLMRLQPSKDEPFNIKWFRLWTLYYTPRLDDCKAKCAMLDDCAGAWAVVGHLDKKELNDTWDDDIYDKYHGHGDHLVYKCYGYTLDIEKKYFTYVDIYHEVDGTRQFYAPDTPYKNDYKVLYSHYWSKSGYVAPETTLAPGPSIPPFHTIVP